MSERYKEICSCLVCVKMKMYQESLNRYRRHILEQLKRSHDRSSRGLSKRRACGNRVRCYETQTNFKETVKESVSKVHCKLNPSLDGPIFDGLYEIKCAYSWCKNCPSYPLNTIEQQLIDEEKLPFISFHTYQLIHQCSEHGPLASNQKTCLFCEQKHSTEKKAKVTTRNKIVSKSIPFVDFFKLYYLKHLKLYQKTQVYFYHFVKESYREG